MRRVLQILAIVAVLFGAMVTPASAWSREDNPESGGPCNPCVKWNNGFSGYYYLKGGIQSHSAWAPWIAEDIAKWNNVANSDNPTWTRTTDISYARLQLDQFDLGDLCGKAYFYWGSGSILYDASANLNSRLSYGGRNGSVGNCNFDWTVLHEVGHTEALGHSEVSTAVMNRFDNGRTSLQPDDIQGIYQTY